MLVVTNEDGGLDAGSSVNFLLIDQRVRFEISLDAAQASGLRVASELLAVAVRVRGRRVYTEAGCDADGHLDRDSSVHPGSGAAMNAVAAARRRLP